MSSYTLTPATFASLLRTVEDDEFAAFVADLRAASGWEVERDGASVLASRPESDETDRLRAVTDDRSRLARLLRRPLDVQDLGEVDTLVVGALDSSALRRIEERHDGTVLTAEDLFNQLLYSVDRSTCQAICARHFDVTIDPQPPSEQAKSGYGVLLREAVARLGGNRRRVAAVALLGVLVFTTAAFGVLTLGDGGSLDPGDGTLPGSDTDEATPVGMGATVVTDQSEPTPTLQPLIRPTDFRITLTDTYYFPAPQVAVESFAFRIQASREQSNDTYALEAARIFTPARRPNRSTLQAMIDGGEYARLADFDEFRMEPIPGLPPLRDTETLERGTFLVTRDNFQTAYGFTAVCRNVTPPRADGCWQLRNVYMLSDDDRPTPSDWATPTPTPIPANRTETPTRTVTSTTTDRETPATAR